VYRGDASRNLNFVQLRLAPLPLERLLGEEKLKRRNDIGHPGSSRWSPSSLVQFEGDNVADRRRLVGGCRAVRSPDH
jgi:hypothetical protein